MFHHLNKKVSIIFSIFILFLLITHPKPFSAESQASISASVTVNVRESPGLDKPIIGKLTIGTSYKWIEEKNGWIKIQYSNQQTGWVAAYLVNKQQSVSSNETETISNTNYATVTESGLRLRKGPGTNYQVLTTLSKNMQVSVHQTQGDWVEVSTSIGNGWVHKDFVQMDGNVQNTATNDSTSVQSSQAQVSVATVIKDSINVRSEASTNSTIIGKLSKDTIIHIIEEQGEWAKIHYSGNIGWVHQSLLSNQEIEKRVGKSIDTNIEIIYNGTNIRSDASVHSNILLVANQGDTFHASELIDNWYKITLPNGSVGYIANWIVKEVSKQNSTQSSNAGTLKNKVIVIDPGHGGKDSGTIGTVGTLEKDLNIVTAKLLGAKLEAAGSKVVYTRQKDVFISLQGRVDISHFYRADAFISIHYDSIDDNSVKGITSYYYTSSQKELANTIHKSITEATNTRDRGVKQNGYFVLKENRQPATLLELGYLSNSSEEQLVLTQGYQEKITTAIYKGLGDYFN